MTNCIVYIGKAELFLEEPQSKLLVDSTGINQSCNGIINDDAGNDSDDNNVKRPDGSIAGSILPSPALSAISKQKGNRLQIRSRSPSPFKTPAKLSQQIQPENSNSLNSTPSINTSTNSSLVSGWVETNNYHSNKYIALNDVMARMLLLNVQIFLSC